MMDWRERITIIGQIVVSVIIAAGFITIRALMIFVEILPANQRSADTFDGALIGAFSAMVGFWIGSSSGGQKKDATIAAQAAASIASGQAKDATIAQMATTPTMTSTSSPSGAATVTATGIHPETKP